MSSRKYIQNQLLNHLPDKRFSILIGARQTGKTTVLKQLVTQLSKTYKTVFYLSFEDPAILNHVNNHPDNIFDYAIHPSDLQKNQRLFLFIDEIQYLQDPTNFLKLIFDKYDAKVKIIATGSSAFYINRDFKDSLAGRKKIFELYPLDFSEFLHFKGEDNLIDEYKKMQNKKSFNSLHIAQLKSLFTEFINYGGYPAVILEKNIHGKIDLLSDLVNSYMKKDALEANLKDELKFFGMVKLLAHQTGNLVNQSELANTLKLSVGTIENYIYLLRKCFHVQAVFPKYGNARKEITKMPKLYFNDLGMRNMLLRNFEDIEFRMDKGAIAENYAFIRLRQKYNTDDIKFWRTADGNEVDFVIDEKNESGISFEIKYSSTQFKASKYKKFNATYPSFPLSPLVYENDASIEAVELFRF